MSSPPCVTMTEHASAPWPSSSSPQSSPVSTPAATTGHKPKMTASSSTAASSFSPAVSSMPPAHPLRRAFTTVGDVPSSQSRTAPFRRRIDSSSGGGAAVPVSSGSLNASGPSSGRPHSTSSTARRPSDLRSLAEARRSLATGADRLLNPRPAAIDADDDVNGRRKHDGGNNGRWAGLPLASALLPAAAGMLFEGAGAFLTDIMLLALAGVFLYWSVTQPWLVGLPRELGNQIEDPVFRGGSRARKETGPVPRIVS